MNSDGRLDVLPNGTDFAAWYELLPADPAGGGSSPRWQRHDLPAELVAHGIGCGDINGDGLNDLVGPRGWAEASLDAGKVRWTWHAELALHRDASVPILVHDVDGDGDADLIWGRGHNVGLYWYEQSKDAGGNRAWTLHAIDTSWSQAHSPLLADIDGDGREDLVAGKRFLGHDGKDPGEYDPLVVFWYGFDDATVTWHRHAVSAGGGCGLDLDPKCVDIDGDGDIDILAPARSGLFLLENLRLGGPSPTAAEPAPAGPPSYPDHSQLLVFRDRRRRIAARSIALGLGPAPPAHPGEHAAGDGAAAGTRAAVSAGRAVPGTDRDGPLCAAQDHVRGGDAGSGSRVPADPKATRQTRRRDAVPAPDQPAGKSTTGRHRRHSHAVLCPRVGRARVCLPGSGLSQFRRVPVRFQNGGSPLTSAAR